MLAQPPLSLPSLPLCVSNIPLPAAADDDDDAAVAVLAVAVHRAATVDKVARL